MAEAPPPMTDAEIRAILGQVANHAADMHATGVRIETKVDEFGAAVKGMRAELDEVKALQLPPMRQKAITLDEITNPAPRAPATPAPLIAAPGYGPVSISPLEAAVSNASVHAVAIAVPAARKENRALSILLALLIVIAQAIQFARGH